MDRDAPAGYECNSQRKDRSKDDQDPDEGDHDLYRNTGPDQDQDTDNACKESADDERTPFHGVKGDYGNNNFLWHK